MFYKSYEIFPKYKPLGDSPFDESIHGSHIRFGHPAHTSRLHTPPRIRRHHKRMVPKLDRYKRPNIEGLQHFGVAPNLRHLLTDFGSGWVGIPWEQRTERFNYSAAKKAVRSLPLEVRSDKAARVAAMLESQRFYHGTKVPYNIPDFRELDDNALFGPGFYATNDWSLAGTYTGGKVPNIRMVEAGPKRTLKLSSKRPFSTEEIDKIVRPFVDKHGVDYISRFKNISSEKAYKRLTDLIPTEAHESSRTLVNQRIVEAGYDSITHVGGTRVGGGYKHRVLIGLNPETVSPHLEKDLPFIPFPSEIPLQSKLTSSSLVPFIHRVEVKKAVFGGQRGNNSLVEYHIGDFTPIELIQRKMTKGYSDEDIRILSQISNPGLNPRSIAVKESRVFRNWSGKQGDFFVASHGSPERALEPIKQELLAAKYKISDISTEFGDIGFDLRPWREAALKSNPKFIARQVREAVRTTKTIMQLGDGAAVINAGTSIISKVVKGARRMHNSL